MPTMTAALEARAAKHLDSLIRADGEVMTMRQLVENRITQSYVPTIAQVEDTATRMRLQHELDRLIRSGEPSGNPNWPATKRYRELKSQLAQPILKDDYRLQLGDRWTVITKTAYEFALSLTN